MPGEPLPTPQPRVGWRPLYLLPVVSGLLLWLGFQFDLLSFFVLFALVPLNLLVRMRGRFVHVYLGAYAGGLAFFLPGIHWLSYADPSAWLGWVCLAAYCALYFPLFILVSRLLNRSLGLPLIFVLPAAWVACEYVRQHLMTGFGWLMIGNALYRWLWTIQIADLGGVYLVSAVVMLANALLTELLTQPLAVKVGVKIKWDPTGALRWRVWLTALVLLFTEAYGWYRVREGEAGFRPGPTVLLLHSATPQNVRNNDGAKARNEVIEHSLATPHKNVDLVVWPETSFLGVQYGEIEPTMSNLELAKTWVGRMYPKGPPNKELEPSNELGEWIRDDFKAGRDLLRIVCDRHGSPLLASVVRRVVRPGVYDEFNSAVLAVPGKGEVGYYDKVHLVPFGEYLPLKNSAPWLRRLMPYPEDVSFGLDPGEKTDLIAHDKLRFSVLICFEDTLPDLAREFAVHSKDGAPGDFIVNQSNDGWFADSKQPWYHAANGLFRCIELRTPMVRATNLGVTCLIDGNGRIRESVPVNVEGHLKVQIPLDGRKTWYIALGDWFPIGCLVAVGVGLLAVATMVTLRVQARLQTRRKGLE